MNNATSSLYRYKYRINGEIETNTEIVKNKKKTVGIVIPTLNSEKHLKALFCLIKQQTRQADKILIIDSSSNDNTIQIAKDFGCIVRIIPKEIFNHGMTRNLSLKYLDTDIIVFTTDDSRPANPTWLESLIHDLEYSEDNYIAATVGLKGSPPHPEYYVRDWINVRKNGFNQTMSAIEPALAPFTDNCNSAYFRKILEKYPFRETGFAEDLIWTKEIRDRGYKIRFAKNAEIYHYHSKSFKYHKKKYFYLQKIIFDLYRIDLGSNLVRCIKCFKIFWIEYLKALNTAPFFQWIKWLPCAVLVITAQILGCRCYFRNRNLFGKSNVYRIN